MQKEVKHLLDKEVNLGGTQRRKEGRTAPNIQAARKGYRVARSPSGINQYSDSTIDRSFSHAQEGPSFKIRTLETCGKTTSIITLPLQEEQSTILSSY